MLIIKLVKFFTKAISFYILYKKLYYIFFLELLSELVKIISKLLLLLLNLSNYYLYKGGAFLKVFKKFNGGIFKA